MLASETVSKALIDKFLISSQTNTNAKALNVASASNTGLDDKTKEVLGQQKTLYLVWTLYIYTFQQLLLLLIINEP